MARKMIEEAPTDGKIYARKDGKWVEINIEEKKEEGIDVNA